MLSLVLSNRDKIRSVEQNIRSHEYRIGQKSAAHVFALRDKAMTSSVGYASSEVCSQVVHEQSRKQDCAENPK